MEKENPELVIGLVGAVGTDLTTVISSIEEVFFPLAYKHKEIRLSQVIRDIDRYQSLSTLQTEENKRIDAHMDAGDHLRSTCQRGDILALLATQKIANIRENQSNGNEGAPLPRTAYILNSLKHPDEVAKLRDIYGPSFLLISVYSPKNTRIDLLAKKIAETQYKGTDSTPFKGMAEALVLKDAKSNIEGYGQNVNDTFPLADIFIKMADKDAITKDLERAIYTWFQHPFHTPNIDELGIFNAKSIALRSSDLSRQVGAVITSSNGEILASGYNEVPKPGGGLCEDNDTTDDREFKKGFDTTVKVKEELVGEILKRLQEAQWLSEDKNSQTTTELVNTILYGDSKDILKGTRVASIIEFGRIVHAEMAAITDAARRGISIKGATIYCTTFPCHMCARHIISSGIARVVFIEPYPKSMTKDLYKNSVIIDGDVNTPTDVEKAVKFESFVGVAPRRYMEFFTMPKRKDEKGNTVTWQPQNASPKVVHNYYAYTSAEAGCGKWVDENKELVGLDTSNPGFNWAYSPEGA